MKKTFSLLLLAGALAFSVGVPIVALSGCQNGAFTVAPGADPVVVTSEHTIAASFDVINSFVEWEHDNRSVAGPGITAIADTIRREAPDKFRLANSLLRTYKANRSAENKANLDTVISVIADLAAKAKLARL